MFYTKKEKTEQRKREDAIVDTLLDSLDAVEERFSDKLDDVEELLTNHINAVAISLGAVPKKVVQSHDPKKLQEFIQKMFKAIDELNNPKQNKAKKPSK